ncbi:MAG: tRNA (adenosine(37)-N6)-dimethylallyltransferase MiaA [Desulfobulbus sp.]|jgi:tRNA dimethylallyltransferase|uniref:tRNA (adenosine(37)-N6)-dimethylallyltransferase MiaA n=1 Tax=Desulfobulbus sp. TaxID=895 RepID=UPI00283F328A|nr:tRNA (adenosine(37)-N6)-dimethylallyltransferase MiaA [Desulfobulbus sp.]MDR2549273.1 tRNA (adenosine(37)-N6)-dimethylallyltransferase MiaA [Desulfobulbus sp.]
MIATAPAIAAPVLALVGPTAIGKTALSLRIASQFCCEIISMDSMQVYRYMDIGTAKASQEEQRQVVHHLIDMVDPDEQYDAARFVQDALAAIASIHGRGHMPLLTGGTGLYLSSLISGMFDIIKVPDHIRANLRQRLEQEGRAALYRELMGVDRESGERIHVNDTQRLLRGLEIFHATGIPWSQHVRNQPQHRAESRFSRLLLVGLNCEREVLYDRIRQRSIAMMRDEFAQEVEGLLARGYGSELPSMQSIGYRHMLTYLAGDCDHQTALSTLIRDTRRYAKRQLTWFRNQQQVAWHQVERPDTVLATIDRFLNS